MARTSVSSSFSTVNLSPAKKLDTAFSPIVPQKSIGPIKASVSEGQEKKGILEQVIETNIELHQIPARILLEMYDVVIYTDIE